MKPFRLVITDSAKADLIGIRTKIAEDSPVEAERFARSIADKLVHLAALGISGSSRDWLSPGLRFHPYKHRGIFFRIIDDEMVVIRILHEKMEPGSDYFHEI